MWVGVRHTHIPNFGAIFFDKVGGSGWESNPPRPAERPATGFEDRGAHRDSTTPVLGVLGCAAIIPQKRYQIVMLSGKNPEKWILSDMFCALTHRQIREMIINEGT